MRSRWVCLSRMTMHPRIHQSRVVGSNFLDFDMVTFQPHLGSGTKDIPGNCFILQACCLSSNAARPVTSFRVYSLSGVAKYAVNCNILPRDAPCEGA